MIGLLFPGQGAQYPGLLREMIRVADAAALFDEASDVLREDVLEADDERALRRTDIVQRNTFLASVATARALQARGLSIDAVAGHSIGAFAAAVVARALSFDDAVRLVDVRGKKMAALFPSGFAMAAIVGFSEHVVEKFLADFEGTYVSAVNALDQITVVGSSHQIARVLECALDRGARTARALHVTVPSHSPLMNPVRDALAREFERIALGKPEILYAANVDGRAKFRASEIARDLVDSVALPVRWSDATEMLIERGIGSFVEVYPGDTLMTMISNSRTGARAISVARVGIPQSVDWAMLQ